MKIECLNNQPQAPKIKRKEFWAAFGEVAPPKDKKLKAQKRREKFRKRFFKKVPDACAKVSVRLMLGVAVVSVLVVCGINPVRLFAHKFM
jgi:hypothetical protein